MTAMERIGPGYAGNNLVNLVAELERRLTGHSPTRGLRSDLSALIPAARNYLLVVFDGLGAGQLAHPEASALAGCRRAILEAPFPTTTTVGLSSICTGLTPLRHGVIGYRQWMPDLQKVVSLLRWTDLSGRHVRYDTASFLPAPNLWERLSGRQVRGMAVQPAAFFDTPLTRMLYRGAEMRGYASPSEVDPAYLFTRSKRTLAMVYHHALDVAAHEAGQLSDSYRLAMAGANRLWGRLAGRLPSDTVMVGTSEHGHCDIPQEGKFILKKTDTEGLRWWGDSRALMLSGPSHRIEALAEKTGSRMIAPEALRTLLGRGRPHPDLEARMPDALLLARDGTGIFPRGMDAKKTGHHGGLTPVEAQIPMLVHE
ncbi:MAG: alkaline phosphatase family protein [Acidimicrobiia bacterium]|nr:alkaline phosphatase family protein [Acidimicrobiia bacterium]